MKNLYVVTSTISDIGKGWLTSCLARKFSCTQIIKIDPVLLRVDGGLFNTPQLKSHLSSDYAAYKSLNENIDIDSDHIIRGGEVLFEFLSTTKMESTSVVTAKRTNFVDASHFFANKIASLIDSSSENIIVEMGGSVNDRDSFYLIDGLNIFAKNFGYKLKPILLSILISSDDEFDCIKCSFCLDSINKVTNLYKVTPEYVFVRDKTNKATSSSLIQQALDELSCKSIIDRNRIIFLPEAKSVQDLFKNFIFHLVPSLKF